VLYRERVQKGLGLFTMVASGKASERGDRKGKKIIGDESERKNMSPEVNRDETKGKEKSRNEDF